MTSGSTRPVFLTTLLILSAFAAASFLTKNPLAIDDGLRHFVMAETYRERGIKNAGNWGDFLFRGYFTPRLEFTPSEPRSGESRGSRQAEHRLDPWFGANLAYLPFTFIPNRVTGIKAAGFAFAVFAFLCFLPFLRRYRPLPFTGVLVLCIFAFGSELFAYRLLIARPYTLMTGIFLLTLFCMTRRRRVALLFLLPILAVSTLFSHLFVFPLLLCLIGAVWLMWAAAGDAPRGDAPRARLYGNAIVCVGCSFLGVALGLLLHPWRSEYLLWLRNAFIVIPFSKELDLGAEVYSGFGFSDVGPSFIIAAVSLLFLRLAQRGALRSAIRERPEIILLSVLTAGFFSMFALWARAIDFFWPVAALLLLALLTTAETERDAFSLLSRPIPLLRLRGTHVIGAVLIGAALMLVSPVFLLDENRSPLLVEPIARIPSGSRVFNPDWDFFPVFLFMNNRILYARGVDPTLDDKETRALIVPLEERGVIPPFRGSLRGWWNELQTRIDWRTLSFKMVEERGVDARSWLADLRRALDPDYLVLAGGRWTKLEKGIREDRVPVLSENGNVTVFSLRSTDASGVGEKDAGER